MNEHLPQGQEVLVHCTAITVGQLTAKRLLTISNRAAELDTDGPVRVKTYGTQGNAMFEFKSSGNSDRNAALFGAVERLIDFPGLDDLKGDQIVGARVGELASMDSAASDWIEPRNLTQQARDTVEGLAETAKAFYLDPADFSS